MEENQNPQANTPQEGAEGASQAPKRRPRISESRFGTTYDPQNRNAYQRGGSNDFSSYGRGSYNRAGGYQRGGYQQDREGGYQPRQEREGYERPQYQRPEGGYERYQRPQRPQNSYNRYNSSYERPQQAPSSADEAQQPQQGFEQQSQQQGGYERREGGYRQGGYGRREGGYGRPQQGGYGRREGGYGRPQQGGYGRREGGYGRPQRPAYNNDGQQNAGYGRREGGYGRREGGYGRPQQGGYGRPQGGYDRQGYGRPQNSRFGGRPRRQGGYNPHRPVEYTEALVDPNEELRLNKFLANAGVCSRREADEYIANGSVKVNGEVVTELGTKVTRKDVILFNDEPVSLERKVYVLLNKPKDTVTTSDDPQGRQTVLDLVRNASQERIYPVGRLDRNTTGVLLLTNDGDLASKLTHPKYVKKKIYHVWLDKDVVETDLAKIAAGIELEDGPIHADAIAYANDEDKNQVGIEIHSGKNRIVRRIFEHLGYRVVKLDRVYFAGLTKKNLPRGRWRHLTQQEVNILKMGAFE